MPQHAAQPLALAAWTGVTSADHAGLERLLGLYLESPRESTPRRSRGLRL